MKNTVSILLFLGLLLGSAFAEIKPQPSVFIDAKDGFDTYIVAGLNKKHVPVTIVSDRDKADYVLTSTEVDQKQNTDSTGTKVTKIIFGVPTILPATVSVKLTDKTGNIVWGYNCTKVRGEKNNRQSLAESIAKHLNKEFISKK